MKRISQLGVFALLLCTASVVFGQETRKFSNYGIEFDYLPNWQVTEKAAKEADEIAIANSDADTQITVMSVRKAIDSKEPESINKQLFEPWLAQLTKMYTLANVGVVRSDVMFPVNGASANGVRLTLDYGGEAGAVEAFWIRFDKKIVLVYMVRPDRTAAKAAAGWDLVRQTLRAEKAK